MCERKKKEENDKWEEIVKKVRNEKDIWEIVIRGRKKRRVVNEGIEAEEWRDYFMELLGGIDYRVVGGDGEGRKQEEGMDKEEINRMELKEVTRNIKVGKTTGRDGIPGEVWKYGGEELEEWVWNFCNRIWKGEGWPNSWKEGIIISIVKKGDEKKKSDYRVVTLMPTLYKVYMMILVKKIEEEIENKRIVPHNQTGFRKKMGTMDNVYVFNYLINRQLGKGKKLVVMFVDLKAAFDTVDIQGGRFI